MKQAELNGAASAPSPAPGSRIIGSGEMADRIRAFPWQDNPLGSVEHWPAELTCIVNMMLANSEMAAVCWGPEKIFLYNDCYLPHLTDRHPAALGKPMWDTWNEMTEEFREMTDSPYTTGKSFMTPPVSVKLFRHGVLEEAYYSVTGNPVFALSKDRYGVAGVYFTYAEHTDSVLQAEKLTATQAASARLQKHLALALESADLAMWFYDPARQEVGGDKKLVETYGFPAGPASASAWIGRLVPEDQERVTTAFAAALTGEPYDVEFRVDIRGSIHWISSKGRLIEDEGKPLFIGICEDITAEKSANLLVLASGQVASWDWNLQNGQVAWKGSEWAYGRPASLLDTPEKCMAFIHPDDVTMLEQALSPATLLLQDFDCEYRVIWPDDSVHWILGKGYSIEADPNGVPTRLIGVNIDITQRKLTEAALLQVEKLAASNLLQEKGHLTLSLDASEASAFNWDLATNVVQWTGRPPLGREPAQLTEPDVIFSFIHPDDRSRTRKAVESALAEKTGYRMEYRAMWPDDSIHWILTSAVVLSDDQGTAVRLLGVDTDITAQKQVEATLVQTEKLAAVGRLASTMAHEINNPLEAVTNLLYLARQSEDMDEARPLLETADAELRRAATITSQALRFHKQASRPVLSSFESLTHDLFAGRHSRLRNAGATSGIRDRTSQPVLCFDGEVRQILNNLVGNAIDALSAKGGKLLVRGRNATDWASGRTGMVLTVADTGSGMSQLTQTKMYDAFFTTKGVGGSGLGLWVTREIVERHAGRLRLRSSEKSVHHGTVFTIFLPYDAVLRELTNSTS